MGRLGIRLLSVILIAGMCLALSGCFLWSSFKWSSVTVKAGGKRTNALIGVVSERDASLADNVVQFFLFGFDDDPDLLTLAGKRTWDVTGKAGGPDPLFPDGALASAAVASDDCLLAGTPISSIPDVDWFAVRTEDRVNDRDRPGRVVLSSVGVKAVNGAPSTQQLVYVVGGGWNDDGDDVPESTDVGCSGGTETLLTIRAP